MTAPTSPWWRAFLSRPVPGPADDYRSPITYVGSSRCERVLDALWWAFGVCVLLLVIFVAFGPVEAI
jgi:hypothetical protein